MKIIDLHGIPNLEPVQGSAGEWYWATDYIHGDLYEAEELFRQGHPVQSNRLYFNIWYEDPDYREETVVRSLRDGAVLDRFSGDVRIMPNGEAWRIL